MILVFQSVTFTNYAPRPGGEGRFILGGENRSSAGLLHAILKRPNSCLGRSSPNLARLGRKGGRVDKFGGPLGGELLGVEAAKAGLDLAVIPSREVWQVSRDPQRVTNLAELVWLNLVSALVGLEATVALETPWVGRRQSTDSTIQESRGLFGLRSAMGITFQSVR